MADADAELAPHDPTRWNALAWCLYLASVRLEEAEELATRAVSVRPSNSYFAGTLAAVQLKLYGWDCVV